MVSRDRTAAPQDQQSGLIALASRVLSDEVRGQVVIEEVDLHSSQYSVFSVRFSVGYDKRTANSPQSELNTENRTLKTLNHLNPLTQSSNPFLYCSIVFAGPVN